MLSARNHLVPIRPKERTLCLQRQSYLNLVQDTMSFDLFSLSFISVQKLTMAL